MDRLTHFHPPTTPDETLALAAHSVIDAYEEAGPEEATGSSVLNQQELNQLEQLDDAIFGALEGDAEALDQAVARWQNAVALVDQELLEESRRQYVRRARAAWKRSQREPVRRLPLAHAALEILGLLDEAS